MATPKGKLLMQHPRDAKEKLGCESCHGPGKQHAESGGDERGALIYFSKKTKTPVAERNAACLQCHEKTARTLWKGSVHETRDVACTSCHTLMHPESERGNLKKQSVMQTCARCHATQVAKQTHYSHMPIAQGKMDCTACHNPHGSPNEKLLVASSVNEVCFACHAEKRGPFMWQHPPVVESCANCHDPHGTAHEKMLKVTRPRLCQQCHASSGHPDRAARPDAPGRRAVRVQPPVLHLPLQHPRLEPSPPASSSTGSMLPNRRDPMKHISCGAAMLLAAGAFALARPTTVQAQDTAKDTTKPASSISVAAEVGGQDWDRLFAIAPNEQQLGKLIEYRDIKTGLVIPQFMLSYTPKDSIGTYQISGRNLLQRDQSFWARASQPGSYDAQVRYDGMVHTYSTDARSLGTFGNGTSTRCRRRGRTRTRGGERPTSRRSAPSGIRSRCRSA